MGKKQTLQDRLRKNKEQIFIGRESFLAAFKDNLTKGDNAKLIFNIHGNGGVGKTTLCNQFKTIASTANAIVVATDESTNNLLEWLAEVSKQLAAQNRTLKDFDSRYRDFQQEKKVIEADPEKPESILGSIVGAGTQFALKYTGMDSIIPPDDAATWAKKWSDYISKKITNKDNVELMLNPELVLSKLFWKNVYETSKDNDSIVFILDTYEATHAYLQTWLLASISGKLGDVPGNISFVIAGRSSLTTNDWSQYTDCIEFIPLEPFSEEEANLFLDKKGITDPLKRADIIAITGRLPIFMVMLATNPDNSTYDTSDIIERFLKWIDSDPKKTLVLKIALLRKFNKDSLVPFLTEEQHKDIDVLFDWLIKQPFVQKRGEYWIYHDTVCKLMRTHERERSPKTWTTQQLDISKFYLQEATNAKTTPNKFEWHNTQWLHPYIEYLFHLLCADKDEPKHSQPVFIALLGVVNRQNWLHLHHFVELFANISKYPQWRELLNNLIDSTQINGINNLNALLSTPAFTELMKLIRQTLLEKKTKHYAQTHIWTALAFFKQKQYPEAIQDFQKSISIDPSNKGVYFYLGLAYNSLKQFDNAIANYKKAINIDPNFKEAYFHLGITYGELNQFDKAIIACQKATDIDPNFKEAYFGLGIIYGELNQFDKAISNCQKAINIDPNFKEAYFNLGIAYFKVKQFDNAIANYQIAIEIDPNFKDAYFNLGIAYNGLKQFDKAIANYQKATDIDHKFKEAYLNLGVAYGHLKQLDKAIQAYLNVIRIEPNNVDVHAQLGFYYLCIGDKINALQHIQQSINLGNNGASLMNLGHLSLIEQREREAIEYYRQSLESFEDKAIFWEGMRDDAQYLTQYGITEAYYRSVLDKI